MIFKPFTAWQYEIAIIASRFKLGLLSDDEMIAFTHKLMDKGYYDDVMLEIIDNDLSLSNEKLSKNFQKVLNSLIVSSLNLNEAKYLNTYYAFSGIASRPFNFRDSDSDAFDYFLQSEEKDLLIDTNSIKEKYYLMWEYIDDCDIEMDTFTHYNLYYNFDTIFLAINDLFLACENWIDRNQPKVLHIMHQLFPNL